MQKEVAISLGNTYGTSIATDCTGSFALVAAYE